MAETDTPTRRGTNRLTPKEIDGWLVRSRGGKPRKADPALKLSDGDGMYLTVTKAGTAVWRLKFRGPSLNPDRAGEITEQVYSIGPYPAVSLAQARTERDRVRNELRAGRNPLQTREALRAANVTASGNTFEVVYREWLQKKRKEWTPGHYDQSARAIQRDVLPELGTLAVGDIRPSMISRVVEAIVNRGAADTAGKVRQHIGGIFRLAQAKGLCDYKENPAEPAREMLPKRGQIKRRPALLKWAELGGILRAADAANLTPTVRKAHRLLAFSAVRISNVTQAEWKEFDLDCATPEWVIPRRKMKAKDRTHDHRIILGPTIAAELREWKRLGSGKGYVFPSPAGGKHITPESLEKAYRVTLGLEGKHTPHGWRSAFSTLARDQGHGRDVVELALDHIHDNEVVRAYDRGERLEQRIKLMTWWDEQLSTAERGADVVVLKRRA
jgi:integrase